MAERYVAVDLETTGNSFHKGDRVIQISAVMIENGIVIDQYTTFVNPGIPIPPFIEELTGITDEMVENAPTFAEIAVRLLGILEDSIFVAHNVPFDLGFLKHEFEHAGFPNFQITAVDTVELAKFLYPSVTSYKLNELSEQLNLNHLQPHRADSDALATAEIFLLMAEKARLFPIITLEMLLSLSRHLKSDIEQLLQSIITEKRTHIEDLSDDLEAFRGIVLKKKTINYSEARFASDDYPKTKEEKIKLLQSRLHNIEVRDQQFVMMDTVYEAFTSETHAIIEAGTGIGKSLAYLIPSLYFSAANNEPVIVSTYTIQLQHQILENEIEKLQKIIPFSFLTAILKGREHYINMLKFEQSLREKDSHYDEVITKMKILVWLLQTETGDIDELNLSSGGRLFWKRIQHDGWFIDKYKDPWHSRDFYLHARKVAAKADIIITNHAMLLSNLNEELQLFPKYNYIVVDEAHRLEKAARKYFGHQLEYNYIKFMLGRLGTLEKEKLFFNLEIYMKKHQLSPAVDANELNKMLYEIETETDDLFTLLVQALHNFQPNPVKSRRTTLRITDEILQSKSWQSVIFCTERLIDLSQRISAALSQRLELLKDLALQTAEQAFIEQAKGFLHEWETIILDLRKLLLHPQQNVAIWLEGSPKRIVNKISIHGQPFNTNDMLSNELFAKKKSVVLTSASLTVNDSFSYFTEEVGIADYKRIETILPSPFHFKEKAKLYIPTDLPEIRSVPLDEYVESIAAYITAISHSSEGRMLVLFTSYEMLLKTYLLLKDSEALDEFILLAQGVSPGSRNRLIKNFQQFQKAILFGTSSFWEGVDIRGKALSCLVIVRLPFSSPDEPVTAAKLEVIKGSGKNAFLNYSLPEAVIQFKQGFGRLIRSNEDRGAIVILDRRIDTASYGEDFLRSIPPVGIERGSLNEIALSIQSWLNEK